MGVAISPYPDDCTHPLQQWQPWNCTTRARSLRRRYSRPHLPMELYRPIIEFVTDRRSLLSLTRVCRATQTEAERMLYASIILHPTENSRLCASILSNNRLPCLVKKCDIFLQLKVRPEWATCPDERNLVRISRALLARLPRFSRLEGLHIQSLTPGVEPDLGRALAACNLRLRSFCCSCPLDEEMIDFLASQREIREVTVLSARVHFGGRVGTKHILNPAPGPTLRSLASLRVLTPQAAQALVADQPVKRVEILIWNDSSIAKVVSSLARSCGPLRSLLVAQGFSITSGELQILAEYLPHLRYLGDCLLLDPLNAYSQDLSALRHLETLVIKRHSLRQPRHHFERSNQNIQSRDVEYHAVLTLSASCPSLRRVIFTISHSPVRCWEMMPRGKSWAEVPNPVSTLCTDLWSYS